jgi:ABC-type sugar transport system substrate-binding protein
VLRTISWQYPEAVEQCREALKSDPKDQTALYRLIQALRKTGQKNEIPDLLKRLAQLREQATVSTVNSIPVLRAIEDVGLAGRATVITSDLFPALGPFIESGRVAATMYQRPSMQGQLAFQALYKFLVDGVRPAR